MCKKKLFFLQEQYLLQNSGRAGEFRVYPGRYDDDEWNLKTKTFTWYFLNLPWPNCEVYKKESTSPSGYLFNLSFHSCLEMKLLRSDKKNEKPSTFLFFPAHSSQCGSTRNDAKNRKIFSRHAHHLLNKLTNRHTHTQTDFFGAYSLEKLAAAEIRKKPGQKSCTTVGNTPQEGGGGGG